MNKAVKRIIMLLLALVLMSALSGCTVMEDFYRLLSFSPSDPPTIIDPTLTDPNMPKYGAATEAFAACYAKSSNTIPQVFKTEVAWSFTNKTFTLANQYGELNNPDRTGDSLFDNVFDSISYSADSGTGYMIHAMTASSSSTGISAAIKRKQTQTQFDMEIARITSTGYIAYGYWFAAAPGSKIYTENIEWEYNQFKTVNMMHRAAEVINIHKSIGSHYIKNTKTYYGLTLDSAVIPSAYSLAKTLMFDFDAHGLLQANLNGVSAQFTISDDSFDKITLIYTFNGGVTASVTIKPTADISDIYSGFYAPVTLDEYYTLRTAG